MIPKPKNRTRWSALVQSWEFIQEQADTVRCYALTDKQAAGLRSIAAYLGWPNRYSDNPLPDWLDTSEYRAQLEAALLEPLECDDMKIRQSPTNYCIMQVSYDGGTTWQTAFNYALCSLSPKTILLKWTIEDGYQASFDGGETWVDGADYDPRASATLFPLPTVSTGQDGRCLAANNVIQELKQNVADCRRQIADLGGITGLCGAFSALMTLLFATAPIAGLVWMISTAAAAIIGYSAGAFDAAFTDEVWDIVFQLVYCSSNDDMSYDENQFNTIYNQIAALLDGIAAIHLENVLGLVGYAGLTNMARIDHGYYDDTNCNCNTWCYTFDFTLSDGGWVQWLGEGANYVAGIGWQDITRSSGYKGLEVIHYFTATAITDIEATIISDNVTNGNVYFGSNPDGWYAINTQTNGTHTTTYTHTGLGVVGSTSILINAAAEYATHITLTRVTMRGIGTNPFGGNNCT